MVTITGLRINGKMTNVRIGDEPGWEDEFQARTILKYLEQNGYDHALLTRTGISMSNGTLTEYEAALVQKDMYLSERNRGVALIARMAIALGLPAGLGRHEEEDKDWDDDWRNIVFIDLPTGQVSWHIHDSDLPMFEFLGQYRGQWDGHTTEEKYQRVLKARFDAID